MPNLKACYKEPTKPKITLSEFCHASKDIYNQIQVKKVLLFFLHVTCNLIIHLSVKDDAFYNLSVTQS